jgi:hypothetical protein
MADAARAASSPSSPVVARQHVISRTVLRRFCEPGPGGLRLARHDVRRGTATCTGPGGAGYVRDFVKIDSQATEALWQQVETRLPAATDAAISHAILTDPALLSVMRLGFR